MIISYKVAVFLETTYLAISRFCRTNLRFTNHVSKSIDNVEILQLTSIDSFARARRFIESRHVMFQPSNVNTLTYYFMLLYDAFNHDHQQSKEIYDQEMPSISSQKIK